MNKDIHNSDNSNPFKTPKEYFSDLENSILLKTVGKPQDINPFKVPNSHFEQLEAAIISKNIEIKKNKKGKIISLFSNKYYWISAAVCLFFAVMIGVFTFINTENRTLANNNKEKAITVIGELYTSIPNEGEGNLEEEINNLYVNQPQKSNQPKNHSIPEKIEKYNKSVQKTSEVIYDLYFEEDNIAIDEETIL